MRWTICTLRTLAVVTITLGVAGIQAEPIAAKDASLQIIISDPSCTIPSNCEQPNSPETTVPDETKSAPTENFELISPQPSSQTIEPPLLQYPSSLRPLNTQANQSIRTLQTPQVPGKSRNIDAVTNTQRQTSQSQNLIYYTLAVAAPATVLAIGLLATTTQGQWLGLGLRRLISLFIK